jgi:hypothetical protein
MHPNRLLLTLTLALGLVAIVPVATALGDDPPNDTTRQIQAVTALGTSFSYQGRLVDAGSPANGAYDFQFLLEDSETGGAQIGSTAVKADVVVTNGLFTTDLDFGAAAFNGDARWIEIQVRAGSSSGAYTVLSPRQSVSPAPYALYAKATGGFVVPLAVSGTSAGAPATTTGLLTVTQAGTGIAISGQRTTTDPAQYPAIIGTNAGGGAGVQGESIFATGVGVQGFGNGATGFGGYFTGNTGVKAVAGNGAAVGGAAVELDGALKVSGANPTAFVHEATVASKVVPSCLAAQCTFINNPLTNADPNAILIITQRYNVGASSSGVYNDNPVGVWYEPSLQKWVIFNENPAVPMPTGARFNVLVIKQ